LTGSTRLADRALSRSRSDPRAAARRTLRAAFTPAILLAAGYVNDRGERRHRADERQPRRADRRRVPALVALIVGATAASTGPVAWLGLAGAGGVALVAGTAGRASSRRRARAAVGLAVRGFAVARQLVAARPRPDRGDRRVDDQAWPRIPNAAFEGLPAAPPGPAPVIALAELALAGTLAPFALFAYGQRASRPSWRARSYPEPLVGTAAGRSRSPTRSAALS
jgi:hypothetical protein